MSDNNKHTLMKTKVKCISVNVLHSSSKSSFCWRKFGSLVIESNGKKRLLEHDKVFCAVCLDNAKQKNEDEVFGSVAVKSYSTKVSTGNLIRHLKEEHQLTDEKRLSPNLERLFRVNRPSTSNSKSVLALNKPSKKTLGRDLALWLCRSLLPFDSVNDDALIDFLKKYNVILTADDLPTRTAISRSALDDVYGSMKSHIQETLKKSIASHAALTTDLWSDCYKRNNYITITLHFINELFAMENVTLVTELIQGPKTAETISSFIQKTLERFELQEIHTFFVSDAGANVKKAASLLSEQMMCGSHLCLGHGLHNLVVVDGIKSTPIINNLVTKCKSIVNTLRSKLPELEELADKEQMKILNNIEDAGQVLEIDETLSLEAIEDENEVNIKTEIDGIETEKGMPKSEVSIKNATPTRWHSTLIMLESLYNKHNQVHINQMLEKSSKAELKITEHEWLLMKHLINFLDKFRQCVTILNAQKCCTINIALVFKMELAEILTSVDDAESLEILRMKKNMQGKLDQRFPTTELTIAATLLDCRFQGIKEVDKYLINAQMERVSFLANFTRRLVKKENLCYNDQVQTPASTSSTVAKCSQEEYAKALLLQLSLKYGTNEDKAQNQDDQIETECWKYFAGCDPKDLNTNIDILDYWKVRSSTFPYLTALAKAILCVPATGTPSERVFSVAGLTNTVRRSRLSGNHVNKIIFVHDNYEKCKKFIDNASN